MKIYKSEVDWWLIVLFVGVFGYPIIHGILTNEYFLSILFAFVLVLFFLFSKTIKYKIEVENLMIWYTKIEIKSIRKIYRTKNSLSSPALSLDRIAIVYNKYDEILISPKERNEFIDELLKINPGIEIQN